MTQQLSRLGRRTVLEGLGLGAVGLAGAALLGCGNRAGTESSNSRGASGQVVGASSGGGLPMNAPKVQGKERSGGTWSVSGGATTFTQHDPGTALGGNIWHVIGEKGLEPDPVTAAIRPHVLSSYEVADPSGTTLIFKVHPKLFIHNKPPWNGRQFTAEDVAWNMERIGGLYAERLKIPLSAFQRASMVANITKAQAVDPLTVKVTLSKPNSAFFNGLMDTRVPFAPKEMDDVGWSDPLKMAGIGPYQVTEWVKDTRTVYKKNERYKEFRPNEPHLDTYQTLALPDLAAQQSAFISGQTQTFGTPTPELVATIKKAKPDANLYTWIDSNWWHIRPSVEYAPFKDLRVRRAIFLSIDYKAIGDGYYGEGWGYQAALCPGYPEAWKPDKVRTVPGYNPDTKAADRAEGAKLLAAAGYPNGKGIDFELIYNGSSESYVANATRFQSQMAALYADMKVTLKPFPDSATFAVPQAAGNFKALSYNITAAPDAAIEMISQYTTGGSRNYGHFSDKGLDTLMDKAIVELNRDARTKMLEEFQQRFIDEWMPMYVLYAGAVKTNVQGDVAGYDTIAGTWFGYSSQTKVCRLWYVDK